MLSDKEPDEKVVQMTPPSKKRWGESSEEIILGDRLQKEKERRSGGGKIAYKE